MKIETKEYPNPKKDEVVMNKITVNYSQSNEINSDIDDNLKLSISNQAAGFYFVMKTYRWAFNDIDELIEILNDFKSKAKI